MPIEEDGLTQQDYFRILFSALTLYIYFQFLFKIVSQIFVLNFSTSGPNITITMVLLAATGYIYPILLKNYWPHSTKSIKYLIGLTILSSILVVLPVPYLPLFGSIVGLFVLTPIIVDGLAILKAKYVLSATLSIIVNNVVRSIFDTAPVFSLTLSKLFFFIILAIWILVYMFKIDEFEGTYQLTGITPLFGFLFLQISLIGSASLMATWFNNNYLLANIVLVLGLIAGTDIVLKEIINFSSINQNQLSLYLIVFMLSMGTVLWVEFSLFNLIGLFCVQVSSVVLLHKGTTHAQPDYEIKQFGNRLGAIQLLLIFILLLENLTANWAFLPDVLNPILKGNGAFYFFILAIILPITSTLNFEWTKNLNFNKDKKVVNPKNHYQFILMFSMLILLFMGTLAVIVNQELVLSETEPDNEITVMTYNVHQWYEDGDLGRLNLDNIKDEIIESKADIIGLQESEGNRFTSQNFDGVRWLANQLDMFYYHGAPTSEQIYGVSILSKWEIKDTNWINMPSEQSAQRIAVEVTVGAPSGDLHIISTHFQTNKFVDDRINQANTIIDVAQKYDNAIILGDFNTPANISDPVYALLNSVFVDTWSNCGTSNNGYTVGAENPTRRIDYIWLHGNFNIIDGSCSTIGGPESSDHLGVYSTITRNN